MRVPLRLSCRVLAAQVHRISTRYASSLLSRAGPIPPPLKGVRILDLTRILAGPTATMLLADLGADVIKVEEIENGDDTRAYRTPAAPIVEGAPAPSTPPESAYFLAVNRNKRSITVNYKEPDGLAILHKLVERSDVLVENYIPGKLAKVGLGWDDCQAINPRLVYASITGYGQSGPYSQAAGYDVVIEAEAGLMHVTGEPDGHPCKVGVAATDVSTGLYAHGAILSGLISVQRTGKGVWIDCNLMESQIAGLVNIASNYLIAGKEGSRHGTAHPSIVPYQVFPCQDGYIMFGAGNNKQFRLLAEKVLKRPELVEDHRFCTNEARVANRHELVKIITDLFMEHPRDHWIEAFSGLGVPFGPINNIAQTFDHPQVKARELVVEVEHPRAGKIKLVGPAVMYNGHRMPVERPPPYLSQHTEEVLKELSYTDGQIRDLRRRKVI